MRIRSRGEEVRALQQELVDAGYRLAVDGIFGPQTDAALRRFQRDHGLVADGILGPKTRRALDSEDTDRLLDQADLEDAAERLGVPLAVVMAVNEVESRGDGFLDTGEPVILFERHLMHRRLAARDLDPAPWAHERPDIVSPSPGGYQGGAAEHRRLASAKAIHVGAAIESASWGLFQILGLHWERLGYASPEDWETRQAESEGHQLDAFLRFVEADRDLLQAMRLEDWPTVARIYNGPQYARHGYHRRLQAAFDRHASALEATA